MQFASRHKDICFKGASRKSLVAENTLVSEATRNLFPNSERESDLSVEIGESFVVAEEKENVPSTGASIASS